MILKGYKFELIHEEDLKQGDAFCAVCDLEDVLENLHKYGSFSVQFTDDSKAEIAPYDAVIKITYIGGN